MLNYLYCLLLLLHPEIYKPLQGDLAQKQNDSLVGWAVLGGLIAWPCPNLSLSLNCQHDVDCLRKFLMTGKNESLSQLKL